MNKTIIKVNENMAKTLEVLRIKSDSLYNLFSSFMNNRFEFYNEIKLEEFIEEYSDIALAYQSLLNGIVLENIGNEKYRDYISPCIDKCMYFDYPNKEIVITWHDKKRSITK